MRYTLNKQIQPIDIESRTSAEGYEPATDRLVKAFDVARLLGKPLLLTGEPGCGKSLFAKWAAHQLNPEQPYLKFVVKSTTDAQDLFYCFDSLARFHDAQTASTDDTQRQDAVSYQPLDYVSYGALGEAILRTHPRSDLETQGWLDKSARFAGFPQQPVQSVVLIDEIDKAPRDVPNDLLDEIEAMSFGVRELGVKNIEVGESALRPIVIITSNSERDLPGPFLRRCVYFDVPFPDDSALRRIVDKRLASQFDASPALRDDALEFFDKLRNESVNLSRKPGVAELLDWMSLLADTAGQVQNFEQMETADDQLATSLLLSALVKNSDDARVVTELWSRFRKSA